MKNVVDVSERTLEKEKKDFISLCKAGEVVSCVFFTIGLFGLIGLAGILIMSATGVADAERKYTSPEGLIGTAIAMLILISATIAANFSVKIFNKLKDGDTPFRYDIADKIKGAGIALMAGGVVSSILEFARKVLVDTGVLSEYTPFGSISVSGYCAFGLFLVALSYIFNYGCKLQQESDETI